MSTIYLHIGHGKTGSSYLQSCFAASIATLRDSGIAYPVTKQMLSAAKGAISSGNGSILTRFIKGEGKKWPADDHVLFSGEGIFRQILTEAEQFISFLENLKPASLKVLFFIRDPVAHAASAYQQSIKREGTSLAEDYFELYNMPKVVERTLETLDSWGAETTIRNYSASRDVVDAAERWLGLHHASLNRPPAQAVNRSMSLAELEFQRNLNILHGKNSPKLSNRLCNALPDIEAHSIVPSMAVQEAMWDRLSDSIDRVNSRLPDTEKYNRARDIKEPSTPDYSLNPEQIRLIVEELARW